MKISLTINRNIRKEDAVVQKTFTGVQTFFSSFTLYSIAVVQYRSHEKFVLKLSVQILTTMHKRLPLNLDKM